MASKRQTFISVLILVLLVIGVHYLDWLKPVENLLRLLISPFSKKIYSLSVQINDETENFSSVDELKTAYQSSAKDLISCQAQTVKVRLLEDENNTLRNQLKYIPRIQFTSVGAEVIGKNIDPLGSTLIINRGSASGIKLSSAVFVDEGIIVGKVVRLEDQVAIVRLINDGRSKIAATLMNQEKSLGVVEGGYGISVQMNYIPQNETINTGDIAVTSGLEESIPRGLLIGTIEAVEKEAYQPFQKAIVKPMINLDKIRMVQVVLPPAL
jgi:rod shape-determining protein MreC